MRACGEPLPREMAAWHGYLAAALEWDLVPVARHAELSGMLPEPPEAFTAHLFLGAEEEGDG